MIDILRKSVIKQIELLNSSTKWREQLYINAPPILWFGNINAKRKIITIGANPSRWEVVKKDMTVENRFRMLLGSESLDTILYDDKLANEIISGYNSYFSKKPYTSWFGNIDSPYKVECFLRGMGATFYEQKEFPYNCIHVDLFPFPTKDDYNKLSDIVIHDLFRTGWSENILGSIIAFIKPEKIIVFGRGNTAALFTYIYSANKNLEWKQSKNEVSYYVNKIISIDGETYPCLGISTNLGNPKPFSKVKLFEFGMEMKEKL